MSLKGWGLNWVVFPAVSDVALSVKCEAFQDLHSFKPSCLSNVSNVVPASVSEMQTELGVNRLH